MALALFRLCFLIMLERTLEGFMKGAMGVTLKRVGVIDHTIKTLGLAASEISEAEYGQWLAKSAGAPKSVKKAKKAKKKK